MFTQVPPSQKQKRQETVRPNPTGIPAAMKMRFENMSGLSFDDVRVHYSSDKPAQLHALAYTQGHDVYVAPGQEEHLDHELGHIVQQKQGQVAATARIGEVALNDDPALEAQADHYAHMAAQRRAVPGQPRQAAGSGAVGGVVQRFGPFDPENYANATQTWIPLKVSRLINHFIFPPSDSFQLRIALTMGGSVTEPGIPNQAHHIVQTHDDVGQSILRSMGIASNSAINGVLLPECEGDDTANASPHSGSHVTEYQECVRDALLTAIDNCGPSPTFKEKQRAVAGRLAAIREVLLTKNVALNKSSDGTYDPITDGSVTIRQIFDDAGLFN